MFVYYEIAKELDIPHFTNFEAVKHSGKGRNIPDPSDSCSLNKLYRTRDDLWQFFYTFKMMDKDINRYYNAIRDGDLPVVQAFIGKNPKLVHSRDSRGSSPLILATYYNHVDIAGFLLENGAAVDAGDASGNTALMGVCFKGYDALAKLLIASGANVNAINTMGASCLIFATSFNREYIVKLLLAHGADSEARDARGKTALDHARMQGLTALTTLLENHNQIKG